MYSPEQSERSDEKMSLRAFCRKYNAPTSSVSDACKALGIPTNQGITPEQEKMICEHKGYRLPEPEPLPEIVEAEIVETVDTPGSLVPRQKFGALERRKADTSAIDTDTRNTEAQNTHQVNAVVDVLHDTGKAIGDGIAAQIENLEPALLQVVLAGISSALTEKLNSKK